MEVVEIPQGAQKPQVAAGIPGHRRAAMARSCPLQDTSPWAPCCTGGAGDRSSKCETRRENARLACEVSSCCLRGFLAPSYHPLKLPTPVQSNKVFISLFIGRQVSFFTAFSASQSSPLLSTRSQALSTSCHSPSFSSCQGPCGTFASHGASHRSIPGPQGSQTGARLGYRMVWMGSEPQNYLRAL